jgi:molybdopterin-synthase adenylyltransferase
MRRKMKEWKNYSVLKSDQITDKVSIIGVGGIGSIASLVIAKLGVENLTIFDFDQVEDKNINNQMYPIDSLGKEKTEAMSAVIQNYVGDINIVCEGKFKSQSLNGVVISAVDSMEQRKVIWESIKLNPAVKFYIDGRMGGELIRIYALNPTNIEQIEKYEKSLYDDPVQVACTEKRIAYNTFINGGLIASLVKKYFNREPIPQQIIFDLKNMDFRRFL